MKIISVTGKIGCGKTYTCGQLQNELKNMGIPCIRISFADDVKIYALEAYGVLKGMDFDVAKVKQRIFENEHEIVNIMMNKAIESIKDGDVDLEKLIPPIMATHKTVMENSFSSGELTRFLMQNIGTEIFRALKGSYWVDLMVNKIKELSSLKWFYNSGVILIDDMRFDNEYFGLRYNFGQENVIVIKKTRDLKDILDSIKMTQDGYEQALLHPSENGFSDNIPYDFETEYVDDYLLKKILNRAINYENRNFNLCDKDVPSRTKGVKSKKEI